MVLVSQVDIYGDNSNVGLVEIQEWDSDAEEWMTMVQITGVAADDRAGWMVSLSGDGSRVAVYSDGAKHTRVFEIGTTCDTSAAPPNAAVGNCPSTLAFGSSCQPECIQNSTADNPTSTCVSGYLKNATCVNNCEVSAPANGGMGNCGDFLADGASCQLECDPGYATSSGSTRCNSGYLSVAYCYTTSCDVFAPANGGMGDCGDVLADGASCQPECDPGYATASPTTCDSGWLDDAYCGKACDVSSAPANGGKGDCGDILVSSSYWWNDASCTPTCDDGYVLKGGVKTTCNSTGFLDAAECRKRYSWGDEKFCPKWEDRMFCNNVETESDCDAATSCVWHVHYAVSGRCVHDDDEFHAMIGESDHDFGTSTCVDHWLSHINGHGDSEEAAAMCNALSNCEWAAGWCDVNADHVKKILSDTGAPPWRGRLLDWVVYRCVHVPSKIDMHHQYDCQGMLLEREVRWMV